VPTTELPCLFVTQSRLTQRANNALQQSLSSFRSAPRYTTRLISQLLIQNADLRPANLLSEQTFVTVKVCCHAN
jgi:hypothetical protein